MPLRRAGTRTRKELKVLRLGDTEIRIEDGKVFVDGKEVATGKIELKSRRQEDPRRRRQGHHRRQGGRRRRGRPEGDREAHRRGRDRRRHDARGSARARGARPATARSAAAVPPCRPMPPVPPLPARCGRSPRRRAPSKSQGRHHLARREGLRRREGRGQVRRVRTIPAGEIGNRNPIMVTSESWYSPELQVTVYSRQSDPRHGETIYRLTNIRRAEPAADLFKVPEEYGRRHARPRARRPFADFAMGSRRSMAACPSTLATPRLRLRALARIRPRALRGPERRTRAVMEHFPPSRSREESDAMARPDPRRGSRHRAGGSGPSRWPAASRSSASPGSPCRRSRRTSRPARKSAGGWRQRLGPRLRHGSRARRPRLRVRRARPRADRLLHRGDQQRSMAVMERLGMRRDGEFDHPRIAEAAPCAGTCSTALDAPAGSLRLEARARLPQEGDLLRRRLASQRRVAVREAAEAPDDHAVLLRPLGEPLRLREAPRAPRRARPQRSCSARSSACSNGR